MNSVGEMPLSGLRSSRVLVTGAGGFVGPHLCKALRVAGAVVLAAGRAPEQYAAYADESCRVNMTNFNEVRKLLCDFMPQHVVHLAATRNRALDLDAIRVGYNANLMGALNLIEACAAVTGVLKVVNLGSCEEYGTAAAPFDEMQKEAPLTAYGLSKLAATQLFVSAAKNMKLPVVILRPTVVYGPGQGADMFLPAMIQALLQGREFSMTPGEQTRDYVYVDDVVRSIVTALMAQVPFGEIFNISSGRAVRIREVALMAAGEIGPHASSLLLFGGRDYRPGEAMNYWASNSKAELVLRWRPEVALDDGVARTVVSIRNRLDGGLLS